LAFALVSNPTSHHYGDVSIGNSASQTFAITNNSTDTIEVMDVFAHVVTMTDEMGHVTTVLDEMGNATTSGDQVFIIQDDQCTDKAIAPNENCAVAVAFSPLQAATFETTLKITHSATTDALSIPLEGQGIEAVSAIRVMPDELNFAATPMQTRSEALTVDISNTSTTDLTIKTLTIEGGDFVLLEHNCPLNSTLTQQCSAKIAFHPQSAGAKSGKLLIESDDVAKPKVEVLLTGEAYGTPDINVQPASGDFGAVDVGTAQTLQFTVSNLGNDGLELGESSVNNDIFTVIDQCANQTLGINQSCTMSVSFKPQVAGDYQGILTIPSNDPDTPEFSVDLSANGVCGNAQFNFSAYPNPLDFGGVAFGEEAITMHQGIFAWSKGCQAIDIDDIQLTGENASDFALEKQGCYAGYWQSYDAVYSSVYCYVKVTLTPTTLGEKKAQLDVSFNNGNSEVLYATANVVDTQPSLSVSEEQVDFGEVKIGFPSENKILTITNTGEVSIRFDKIALSGGDVTDFQAQSWQCHPYYPLKPNQSCELTLRFNPSSEGDKQTDLVIESNAEAVNVPVTGTAISADVCNNPTIESTSLGEWDNAATWGGSVPTENDVVKISSIVSASSQAVKVKSLCVATTGMLVSPQDGSAIDIQASEYIENKGTILGAPGASESSDVTCTNGQVGKLLRTGGQCAQPGASIILKVGANIQSYGKAGDFWWYSYNSGGPIYNTGTIQAGNGGNAKAYAADGGAVLLLGRNTTNLGKVLGGHGGNLTGTNRGAAGNGGLVQLWGKLGGAGYLKNFDGAEVSAGDGGNCNANATIQQRGGDGGNLWLVSLPDVFLNNSINRAGDAGANCHPAKDGWIRIEPGTISLSGQGTKLEGGDIYIYGGQDWTLDMSNMSPNAI
jgi:hypothetical protein